MNLKEEWHLPGNDGGRLTIGLRPIYSIILFDFKINKLILISKKDIEGSFLFFLSKNIS